MQVNTTTLNHLYQRLNPAHDRAVDRCELRADSPTAPLRVKTRKAFWTSVSTRTAHQGYAMAQVRDMLGNSVRARQPHADAAEVNVQVNAIWSRHIGAREVIRLDRVRLMDEDVRQLPRRPVSAQAPASGPVQWHGPLATPPRYPDLASAAAPYILKQAAAATPPATASDRALFTTPPTAAERMRRRTEATTRLKAAFGADATPAMTPQDRKFFQRRLDDVVALAARRSPELLGDAQDGPAILSGAAGRILGSRQLLMSTSLALYNELAARDPARAERLMLSLSLAERSTLRQNLALQGLPAGPVAGAR